MNEISVPGARSMGLLALCLLLSACLLLCISISGEGGAAAAPRSTGLRTIGIVSAIGDTFHVRKIGLMVFGNDAKEFSIDSWHIDDLAVAKARGLLGKTHDVRSVTYRRAAIASAPGGRSGLADTLRAAVAPQGLDTYLVMTKTTVQYGGTNQTIGGLGIVEGAFDNFFIYAIYQVALVDGRDFSPISRSVALLPGDKSCNPLFKPFICGANRAVDKTWWPASLDAASNQRLKGAMVEFVDKSLPNTLRQMELTN
jgi:hypothetical protein